MISDAEDLLTSIYSGWDLVSDQEKNQVNALDDKLTNRGSISPAEVKELKRLVREIKNRGSV